MNYLNDSRLIAVSVAVTNFSISKIRISIAGTHEFTLAQQSIFTDQN